LLIVTLAVAGDVQPEEFVTVKLYTPGASEEIVIADVLPLNDPGFMVQLPEGKPLSKTLPVVTEQSG